MTSCDDYQIAFEQRHAGAPTIVAVGELEAHVATCDVCARYVSVSREVSQSMSATISTAPPLPSADELVARIAASTRQLRRARVALPVAISLVRVIWQLAGRDEPWTPRAIAGVLVGAIAGCGVGFAVITWLLRRPLAELHALDTASPAGLLVGWRRELDRRVRIERQAWWLLPLLLVAFQLVAVGGRVPGGRELVFEALYAVAMAIVIPISVHRYRRLVRERDQLDR